MAFALRGGSLLKRFPLASGRTRRKAFCRLACVVSAAAGLQWESGHHETRDCLDEPELLGDSCPAGFTGVR